MAAKRIILCAEPASRQERWRQKNKPKVAKYMRRYRKKQKAKKKRENSKGRSKRAK